MLETFFGSGAFGFVLKHFVPGRAVNKFIPYVNTLGSIAYMKSQGFGWGDSVFGGLMSAMAAGKVHSELKENTPIGEIRFRGQTI